jgi:hypothetical protein
VARRPTAWTVLVASGEKRMSTTIVEKYFETWNDATLRGG